MPGLSEQLAGLGLGNLFDLGTPLNPLEKLGNMASSGFDSVTSPEALKTAFGDKGSLGLVNGTVGTLGAINSFINGRKATALAQDQFDFTKNLSTQNYQNGVQNYNTSLENNFRQSNGFNAGANGSIQAYLDKNRINKVAL